MKRIAVSGHAVDRAVERWPEQCKQVPRATVSRWIGREVAAAIEAGRMAVNMPRFAVRSGCQVRSAAGRMGPVRSPSSRYVWTEDERRVYVVKRGSPTVVLTVFRPDSAEDVAA